MISTTLREFIGDIRFVRDLPEPHSGLLARKVTLCGVEAINRAGLTFAEIQADPSLSLFGTYKEFLLCIKKPMLEIVADSDINAKTVFLIETIRKISEFHNTTGSDGSGYLLVDEQLYMDLCDVSIVKHSVAEIMMGSDVNYIRQVKTDIWDWESMRECIPHFPILGSSIVGDQIPTSMIESFSRDPTLCHIVLRLGASDMKKELKDLFVTFFKELFSKESLPSLIGRTLKIYTFEEGEWKRSKRFQAESNGGHLARDRFEEEMIRNLDFFPKLFNKSDDVYFKEIQLVKKGLSFLMIENDFHLNRSIVIVRVKDKTTFFEDLSPEELTQLGFLELAKAREARRPPSAMSPLFATPGSPSICETSAAPAPSPVPFG